MKMSVQIDLKECNVGELFSLGHQLYQELQLREGYTLGQFVDYLQDGYASELPLAEPEVSWVPAPKAEKPKTERKTRTKLMATPQDLQGLLAAGARVQEIADKYGVSYGAVQSAIKKHGLKRKSPGQAAMAATKDKEFEE